jgi:hypothetical protein
MNRRRIQALLACAAAMLAVVGPACGDDDEEADTNGRPAVASPGPGGRVETPHLIFEAKARRPVEQLTVGGKRLDAGAERLVVVRLRLTNRRPSPLRVGQLEADFEPRRGPSYPPLLADGREATAPVFAEPLVSPRGTVTSTVVYRVPLEAIAGADLQVKDPVRRQRFELSLF